MVSDAEQRLAARGIVFEEQDFGRYGERLADDLDTVGVAKVGVRDGGSYVAFAVRWGISDDDRARFAEWAEQRLDRFLEHGPEPDGWMPTPDGGYQMWARTVVLPSLG